MKLGLVVEGGASRVYFATGVMDFLLEKKIIADYVIGASAGIADAVSYISGQYGRNLEIGVKYLNDKRYMGMRHLLNPKKRSYYNVDFVFDGIDKYVPFDYEAYNNSGCKAIAAVTNLETGSAEYIDISTHSGSWAPLIASCSLPLLFQPVKIGGAVYLDGGIADPIPVNKAIEDGCDKIIVITSRERSFKKNSESGVGMVSFLYRKYPAFADLMRNRVNIYNSSHENVLNLEKNGRIFLIAPEDTTGWRRTEADPEKIRKLHNMGYEIAKNNHDALLKYLKQ